MADIPRLATNSSLPKNISSSIKRGADSLTLTSEDLFDKIINLKFIRQDWTYFTLRSDYEAVVDRDNKVQYRVCTIKPQIKISYKQMANSVAIEVDIQVTNLYVDGANLEQADKNPVRYIDVQMGYRKQFDDWTQPPWNTNSVSEFYAMRPSNNKSAIANAQQTAPNSNVSFTSDNRQIGRILRVTVLNTNQLGTPPDRVTQFNGIVGTVFNGLRWQFTEKSFDAFYGKTVDTSTTNELNEVFYNLVTQRFVNSQMYEHEVTEESTGQKLYIIEKGEGTLIRRTMLTLTEGRMSVADAWQYGVKVHLSKVLRDTPAYRLPLFGLTEEEKSDVVLETMSKKPALMQDMQEQLSSQLIAIQEAYPSIRYFALSNGEYFVYHKKETDAMLWSDPWILDKEQRSGPLQLPAVYDFTMEGVRKIRAPFVTWVSPGDIVAFQSNYSIGTLVSFYYYPKPGDNTFLVIFNNVKFDTTGEDNEMELTVVDRKVAKTEQKEKPLTKAQEENNKPKFMRVSRTVDTNFPAVGSDFGSRWTYGVAKLKAIANAAPKPTTEQIMATLKEDNQALWDNEARFPSPEGSVGGVAVPILKKGDAIAVRFPVVADYAGWEERKV